jgi:hypothetical protein
VNSFFLVNYNSNISIEFVNFNSCLVFISQIVVYCLVIRYTINVRLASAKVFWFPYIGFWSSSSVYFLGILPNKCKLSFWTSGLFFLAQQSAGSARVFSPWEGPGKWPGHNARVSIGLILSISFLFEFTVHHHLVQKWLFHIFCPVF